jgi:hypothetical protein
VFRSPEKVAPGTQEILEREGMLATQETLETQEIRDPAVGAEAVV